MYAKSGKSSRAKKNKIHYISRVIDIFLIGQEQKQMEV
jgi:hypothetical protein